MSKAEITLLTEAALRETLIVTTEIESIMGMTPGEIKIDGKRIAYNRKAAIKVRNGKMQPDVYLERYQID